MRVVPLLLAAVDRIVEKISEVVPQHHRAMDHVEAGTELPMIARRPIMAGDAPALGLAAIGRIERAGAGDDLVRQVVE